MACIEPSKLCKDCRWCGPTNVGEFTAIFQPICQHKEALFSVDVVHGTKLHKTCESFRDGIYADACGFDAKYFEPRPLPWWKKLVSMRSGEA